MIGPVVEEVGLHRMPVASLTAVAGLLAVTTAAAGCGGGDTGSDQVMVNGGEPQNPLIPTNTNETNGGRIWAKRQPAAHVWAYLVICCGHFPDGAEKFTPATLEGETKPEWYLRQMLGTANFRAGPVLAFLSGNLCYQIEHHLFPDLPSNRYAQIAARVRAVCATYDLPYTTGPLARQYLLTLRTIFTLALPDRFLGPTFAERDTHRCGGGLVTGAQPGFTSWSATRSDEPAATSRMAS